MFPHSFGSEDYVPELHGLCEREFARELFQADVDPDLPGHTDAAQIFASDFKLESNAICFHADPTMNPLSESYYNVVDFRTVTNCCDS